MKELDTEFEDLAKSEGVGSEQYMSRLRDIFNVNSRIDQILRNIKENSEKTDQQLREMEDRIIAGMSNFLLIIFIPNIHEIKRPTNVTFRDKLNI